MNDEDESNAWVPPDDECSEGSSSSYVHNDDDDVPCLPFDEHDAMEYNNDEVCDEQMNCTNAMETEISAITQNMLMEMFEKYDTQKTDTREAINFAEVWNRIIII